MFGYFQFNETNLVDALQGGDKTFVMFHEAVTVFTK